MIRTIEFWGSPYFGKLPTPRWRVRGLSKRLNKGNISAYYMGYRGY